MLGLRYCFRSSWDRLVFKSFVVECLGLVWSMDRSVDGTRQVLFKRKDVRTSETSADRSLLVVP